MDYTSFRFHSFMPISPLALQTLRSMVRSRAELQLENLALRHQICVLQRSARKRSKLTPLDRLFWVCLTRIWSNGRSTLVIVKPGTVVAWHRKCFRLFWTWKVRHGQPGRPGVPREVRVLICQMCRENPTWGACDPSRRCTFENQTTRQHFRPRSVQKTAR